MKACRIAVCFCGVHSVTAEHLLHAAIGISDDGCFRSALPRLRAGARRARTSKAFFSRRHTRDDRQASQDMRGGCTQKQSHKLGNWAGLSILRHLRSFFESTLLETKKSYDPLALYKRCLVIVAIWISTGTIFYSYCNRWPLPQSFFYAVDAGMSIGFCTEVVESKLTSKAFTIVYILMGASVITGALSVLLQESLESLSSPAVEEYQILLERSVFDKVDVNRTGELSFPQFQSLIVMSYPNLSLNDIQSLWKRFDRLADGVIHFEEFSGSFRSIDQIIQQMTLQKQSRSFADSLFYSFRSRVHAIWGLEHRIYSVCIAWILLGVLWGQYDQGWDIITATHFAISALATGGLTAPSVNNQGILPAEPSVFCGVYCLFGIPLFALTLAHFAKILLMGHLKALERATMTRPLSATEFELAKHLTTKDSLVHLSDFIVLQLLRQGKITKGAITAMTSTFEDLDCNNSGTLTLEEATSTINQDLGMQLMSTGSKNVGAKT